MQGDRTSASFRPIANVCSCHMDRLINRRRQGDLGEASAIEWLTSLGVTLLIPFGHSPDFDLVAEANGRLVRIQVKSSTQRVTTPSGDSRSVVALVTRGGNQTWGGVSKRLDPSRFDSLRTHRRRPEMVHSLLSARGSELDLPRRAEVLGVRDRVRASYRTSGVRREASSRIETARGGVSKRSKDGGCKPSGSAFAGSNPASPISSEIRLSAVGLRPQGRAGRRSDPQPEAWGDPAPAGLQRGGTPGQRPCARAHDGDGRLIIDRIEPPPTKGDVGKR
jgi:PD-(D/E)XK endonuclease